MWLLTILLGLCVVGLTIFYRRRQNQHGVFKRMGIPGPQPHWLLGNVNSFQEKYMYIAMQDWTKQFGKYFGMFKGPQPILVSSDMDFLQEVFITRFSHFHGREGFVIRADPDTAPDLSMFAARGKRWKRLRSIIVPTFSTAKMKQMTPVMRKCVDILVDNFSKVCESGEPTDVHKLYQGLTLQVIAECGMGWAVESQTNPHDPFLVHCQKFFSSSDTKNKPLFFRIAEALPDNGGFYMNLFKLLNRFITNNPLMWLMDNVHRVIDMRKADTSQSGTNYVDLLQLMINAESESALTDEQRNLTMTDDKYTETDDVATADTTLSNDASTGTNFKKALTYKEMERQILLFIMAGYETTSTALVYCTYLLALHPDVQARVQAEVDTVLGDQEEMTYEMLQKMTYLHSVIQETLRLYPLGSFANIRQCMEECTVKNISIPKDMLVAADVWSIHHDPDLWPQPNRFDPERFSAEHTKTRHPLAWMPFGVGPRNCVGMRFALLEAKMALAAVLRKYTLKTCAKTEIPLTLSESATVTPKNGVWLTVVPRQ